MREAIRASARVVRRGDTASEQPAEIHGLGYVQDDEREGVVNPIESLNIIKSLQKTLNTVDLELQKCPTTD